MKNITLSADEKLITTAREKARSRKTTLNAEFRDWLKRYAQSDGRGKQRVHAYRRLMAQLDDVSSSAKRYSRDEMNER